MQSRNPDWRAYTAYKIERNRFHRLIGLEFVRLEPGVVEAELPFQPALEQQNGYLHGGVTSAVCDMVAGFAAYTLVEQDRQVFTVECKVSYYHPGIADRFYARGWVAKAGRMFHFCESEVYYLRGDEKVIVAKSTTTMAVKES